MVVPGNVLFFDRKPSSETAWTQLLWIYNFRTNVYFTLKQKSSLGLTWTSLSNSTIPPTGMIEIKLG